MWTDKSTYEKDTRVYNLQMYNAIDMGADRDLTQIVLEAGLVAVMVLRMDGTQLPGSHWFNGLRTELQRLTSPRRLLSTTPFIFESSPLHASPHIHRHLLRGG